MVQSAGHYITFLNGEPKEAQWVMLILRTKDGLAHVGMNRGEFDLRAEMIRVENKVQEKLNDKATVIGTGSLLRQEDGPKLRPLAQYQDDEEICELLKDYEKKLKEV
jgi:hypothetical protein